MKYVVISDFVYPNYIGGSGQYVYALLKVLSIAKKDFLLITRKPKNSLYMSKNKINDPFYVKCVTEGKVSEVSDLKSLVMALKKINSDDIINIHSTLLGLAFIFRHPFKKFIYTFHGPYHEEYRATVGCSRKNMIFLIKKCIQKTLLKCAMSINVLSEFMEREVIQLCSCKQKIKILGPLFDPKFKKYAADTIQQLRRQYKLEDKKILITVRRLTKRTGVLELIDWFSATTSPKYHLFIIGQGELLPIVQEKILANKNITLCSEADDKQLEECLNISDLFILPSIALEGFGLVILESFSIGLPVIISDKSGGAINFIKEIDEKLIFSIKNSPVDFWRACNYALSAYPKKMDNFVTISKKYQPDQVFLNNYFSEVGE